MCFALKSAETTSRLIVVQYICLNNLKLTTSEISVFFQLVVKKGFVVSIGEKEY